MDSIKQHFEDEAVEFDRLIVTLIPDYLRMVEALVAAIPFECAAPLHVIDLGCGTGTVAKNVLDTFSHARVTCVDVAEKMITVAQAKLAGHPNVRYVVADFNSFEFDDKYDVVVSSLALHHLVTGEDKRRAYGRIYESLNRGGVFYNADVVLGSNDFLQEMYMRQWREFMRRRVPQEEVEATWIPKYYAEDRPAELIDQLSWLTAIGFTDVDVIWKYYNFAVYGGAKP
jgi:tRNA (cmo5U34)-methyltransferase